MHGRDGRVAFGGLGRGEAEAAPRLIVVPSRRRAAWARGVAADEPLDDHRVSARTLVASPRSPPGALPRPRPCLGPGLRPPVPCGFDRRCRRFGRRCRRFGREALARAA